MSNLPGPWEVLDMNQKPGLNFSTLSRWKRLLFWPVILVIPVMALEVGFRIYFAHQLGSSMLFYGTSLNREKSGDAHSGDMNVLGSYHKYHPHQERFTRDYETRRLIRATINGRGFRGREFEKQKDPHTIRVVTLGASSTFGFSNRDDETYPYLLEQLLNQEHPGGDRVEAMNFGIPHLTSAQIVALFEAEALPLNPDVVTFYEGINNTSKSTVWWKKVKPARNVVREKLRKVSPLRRSFVWMRDHFITVVLADGFLKKQRHITFTEADYEAHAQGKSENFLRDVSAIYDECQRRGITFIVANQQAKSLLIDREDIKGVTYKEEVELVRRNLAENKRITDQELYFLTHDVLMTDLEKWAKANHVPFVDVIGVLDQRRDCLLSWVHLTPEGNRIVAAAFARAILEQIAPHHAAHVD
jgi:lysophospholipase L1-like esterase